MRTYVTAGDVLRTKSHKAPMQMKGIERNMGTYATAEGVATLLTLSDSLPSSLPAPALAYALGLMGATNLAGSWNGMSLIVCWFANDFPPRSLSFLNDSSFTSPSSNSAQRAARKKKRGAR